MCPDVSTFNKLFDYLEDKALEKDKSDIYKCISCIVTKLFSEFCNAVASKPKTKERDQNLETIAIILLIEFVLCFIEFAQPLNINKLKVKKN